MVLILTLRYLEQVEVSVAQYNVFLLRQTLRFWRVRLLDHENEALASETCAHSMKYGFFQKWIRGSQEKNRRKPSAEAVESLKAKGRAVYKRRVMTKMWNFWRKRASARMFQLHRRMVMFFQLPSMFVKRTYLGFVDVDFCG